jgi:hypothetical protein
MGRHLIDFSFQQFNALVGAKSTGARHPMVFGHRYQGFLA